MDNDSDMPVHVRCVTALRCNIMRHDNIINLSYHMHYCTTAGHQSDLLTLVTLAPLVSVATYLHESPERSILIHSLAVY